MARSRLLSAFTVVALWIGAPVYAATVGFTEDFNAGQGGFTGGSESYTVFSSGGAGGDGDGYLEISQSSFAFHLGVQTEGAEFTGDLLADGVTGFSLWLNELGTDNQLEIHIGVGNAGSNFWLSVDGFRPPTDGWGQFTVDVTDETAWVQTMGSGSFDDALRNSNRLLIRHDVAPFGHVPDATVGTLGVDRITVVPEPGSLLLFALATLAGMRRRHSPLG